MNALFSKLIILISFLSLIGCGGDSPRSNPHNERFIIEELATSNDSETQTSNEETVNPDDDEEQGFLVDERNFICDTGESSLSTSPAPKYIQVGAQGKIEISNDGFIWNELTGIGITTNLNAAAVGINTFVVVGDDGAAYCSPNGRDWFSFDLNGEEDTSVEREDLHGVATNGNQFVIVGANGAIYTNISNTEWNRVAKNQIASDFYDVVWGRDQFVIVGGRPGSASTAVTLRSYDGGRWTIQHNSNIDQLFHVMWTGSFYLAGGFKHTTDDCENDCEIQYAAYLSKDGFLWSQVLGNLTGSNIVESQIVALEQEGDTVSVIGRGEDLDTENSVYFRIYRNILAASWETEIDFAYTASDMNLGDNYEVFTVCPSIELKTFSRDAIPEFYGSRYVAVAEEGKILSSHKGEVWEEAEIDDATEEDFKSVIRTQNSFYAVGDKGLIACSRNGMQWRKLPSGTEENLTSISSDGNILIAVGENGTLLTSVNGSQWDSAVYAGGRTLKDVSWLNDRFIVLGGDAEKGENGFVMVNTSPTNPWTNLHELPGTNALYLNDIARANNFYYAVGFKDSCPGDEICRDYLIMTSTNAEDWTEEAIVNEDASLDSEFSLIAARGNELMVIGKAIAGTLQGNLTYTSNRLINEWEVSNFNNAGSLTYYSIFHHNGVYYFSAEGGVFSQTSGLLDDLDISVISNLDIYSLALNGSIAEDTGDVNNPTIITAVAGELFSYTPAVKEPDGQRLIFEMANKPSWAILDTNTGTLYGTPPLEEIDAVYDASRLSAKQDTSQTLSATSFLFQFDVVENNPPIIYGDSPSSLAVTYNDAYFFAPTAYDKDGEMLKFGIEIDHGGSWYRYDMVTAELTAPVDAWLTFDPDLGILYGTPEDADIGEYSVSITVDDDVNDEIPATALETFTLSVSKHPSEIQF